MSELLQVLRGATSPYLPRTYDDELRWFPLSVHYVSAIVLLLLVAVAYPFVASSFFLNVLNFALIAVIGAVGLQLVTGMAGQLSLGHAAFLLTGAFTGAALHLHFGLGFLVALPVAGLAGAALGLVAGLPALRLRGLYLGITTLAVQSIVLALGLRYQLYLQDTRGTGADLTLPIPDLGFVTLASAKSWYPFLLIGSGLAIAFAANLRRSVVGRDWLALRSGEVAADALGVPVARRKVQAFVVSSVMGSLAGVLSAYYFRSVTVEDFGLLVSVEYLAMVIIGGLGSVLGAVLGALFLTITPFVVGELITVLGLQAVVGQRTRAVELGVFALLTIGFLLFEPGGLAALWRRVRDYFSRWPYQYVDTTRTQR